MASRRRARCASCPARRTDNEVIVKYQRVVTTGVAPIRSRDRERRSIFRHMPPSTWDHSDTVIRRIGDADGHRPSHKRVWRLGTAACGIHTGTTHARHTNAGTGLVLLANMHAARFYASAIVHPIGLGSLHACTAERTGHHSREDQEREARSEGVPCVSRCRLRAHTVGHYAAQASPIPLLPYIT